MKAEELNKLHFKEFLPVVYDELAPYLFAELDRLRAELVQLPEETEEKQLLDVFEKSVEKLNAIDESNEIESGIDTEEREGLCAALYKMGEIVGLDEDSQYLDEWRDW